MRLALFLTICIVAVLVANRRVNDPSPSVTAPPIVAQHQAPRTTSFDFDSRWEWATHDPSSSANYARSLPPCEARTEWLRVVANEWTRLNSTAAFAWARENLGAEDQQQFLANCSNALSPFDAAALVAQLSPGELQNEAALAVVSRWAAVDFQAASAWVEKFEGPLRILAIQKLQARANPRQWAEGFPDGAL